MKYIRNILVIVLSLSVLSCEKSSEKEEKPLLKSVNMSSNEVVKFYYANNKLTRYDLKFDAYQEDEDYDICYIMKFDVYYKDNGLLERIVSRDQDTTIIFPSGTITIDWPETVYKANYNSSNNFCGIMTSFELYTFEFNDDNSLKAWKLKEHQYYLDYDINKNIIKYSYYYNNNLRIKNDYEYDNRNNPFYFLKPIWGIFEKKWPPVYQDFICISPNNPIKLINTYYSTPTVYNYDYTYNEMGYPVSCTVRRTGIPDKKYSFIYY